MSIGIKQSSGNMDIIMPRGTFIKTCKSSSLVSKAKNYTFETDSNSIVIPIYAGERLNAS